MVVLKGKAQTQSSSPLSIAPKSEAEFQKEALSFSQLLQSFAIVGKNVKSQKTAETATPLVGTQAPKQENLEQKRVSSANTKLQTPLQKTSLGIIAKAQTSTLKQTDDQPKTQASTQKSAAPKTLSDLMSFASSAEVSIATSTTLTPSELKVLIREAKEYLKTKIMQTEGYKKLEIAELPKTLKGLSEVAQKFGIDLSKITLEEVKPAFKVSLVGTSQESQTQNRATESTQKDAKTSESKEPAVAQVAKKVKETPLVSQGITQQKSEQITKTVDEQIAIKPSEQKAESKESPLQKALEKTQMSTQEMTLTKAVTADVQKPKEKSDENLKLLLRTQGTQKSQTGLTPEFSVATAKVIAPNPTQTQPQLNGSNEAFLESFLQAKQGEEPSTLSKLDTQLTSKAESVEVKINEAKQMMRYLSQDVKSAIEEYKSPFTRIKVQLNPQRLGEVDLTVVQRGSNLHVTLTSNNTAINTLAVHAADLKQQLANNGINNATLNFSNTPQQGDSAASQQQSSQHKREEARQSYSAFEKEEVSEEILSSLEIVVAHYA